MKDLEQEKTRYQMEENEEKKRQREEYEKTRRERKIENEAKRKIVGVLIDGRGGLRCEREKKIEIRVRSQKIIIREREGKRDSKRKREKKRGRKRQRIQQRERLDVY